MLHAYPELASNEMVVGELDDCNCPCALGLQFVVEWNRSYCLRRHIRIWRQFEHRLRLWRLNRELIGWLEFRASERRNVGDFIIECE